MAAKRFCFSLYLALFLPFFVYSLPENGRLLLTLNQKRNFGVFAKSLYKDSSISVTGKCIKSSKQSITISWALIGSQCPELLVQDAPEFYKDLWGSGIQNSQVQSKCEQKFFLKVLANTTIVYLEQEKFGKISNNTTRTSKMTTSMPNIAASKKPTVTAPTGKNAEQQEPKAEVKKNSTKKSNKKNSVTKRSSGDMFDDSNVKQNHNLLRVKRDDKKEGSQSQVERKGTAANTNTNTKTNKKKPLKHNQVQSHPQNKYAGQTKKIPRDGIYVFMLKLEGTDGKDFVYNFNVEMKDKNDRFLSAIDWPLLPFYGAMSLVYLTYGIVWLCVSACQWRDLLRIQFWIGGVIALGMLEKALFYAEYNNVYYSGERNSSLLIFAELVSCLKRTLARMLIIIVSMGFGIVKPRLGGALHRVLGVGALYFILSAVEGCIRTLNHKAENNKGGLIASIPLAVLDSAICWWIFMSLVQTTRTLRIRRNVVKLSLYKHFTNTLIFAVLASVVYMIWSIKTHRFNNTQCMTDWKELWLDEAFWHFLFSLILLVIMILWRPTANNQRYAFTPLVDIGEDDDDNMTLSEAFEGMKMRNTQTQKEGMENSDAKNRKKIEDDLKWVEENIPSSAADTALPSLLDSDEELMTRKYEMSKME